ncbi:inverse autotransporter beta domain-containing protein [Biostraticola tofi]|uniref:Inverse autotransporter-like protein with beta domain n=1 Tax=Biostraticola tofi TaxID=466109 RepID=A0A4R3YJC7_9GAMM|nr:inverse autotransporter beta domain-containing protein [Biostraticola tofi]TCV92241.1 inverse autotransporter-like protein with beta domain [Biostraticola tofi]
MTINVNITRLIAVIFSFASTGCYNQNPLASSRLAVDEEKKNALKRDEATNSDAINEYDDDVPESIYPSPANTPILDNSIVPFDDPDHGITLKAHFGATDGGKNENSFELLNSRSNREGAIFFNQLGIHQRDHKNTLSIGVGHRFAHKKNTFGYNVFWDNEFNGINSQRAGMGVEYFNDYLHLSANGYTPLSGWHLSREGQHFKVRPASGYDVQAKAWLPDYPQLDGKLKFAQYLGDDISISNRQYRGKDPFEITVGVNYRPISMLSLGIEKSFMSRQPDETKFNISVKYMLGTPLSQQLAQHPEPIGNLKTLSQQFVERSNVMALSQQLVKQKGALTPQFVVEELPGQEADNVDDAVDLDRQGENDSLAQAVENANDNAAEPHETVLESYSSREPSSSEPALTDAIPNTHDISLAQQASDGPADMQSSSRSHESYQPAENAVAPRLEPPGSTIQLNPVDESAGGVDASVQPPSEHTQFDLGGDLSSELNQPSLTLVSSPAVSQNNVVSVATVDQASTSYDQASIYNQSFTQTDNSQDVAGSSFVQPTPSISGDRPVDNAEGNRTMNLASAGGADIQSIPSHDTANNIDSVPVEPITLNSFSGNIVEEEPYSSISVPISATYDDSIVSGSREKNSIDFFRYSEIPTENVAAHSELFTTEVTNRPSPPSPPTPPTPPTPSLLSHASSQSSVSTSDSTGSVINTINLTNFNHKKVMEKSDERHEISPSEINNARKNLKPPSLDIPNNRIRPIIDKTQNPPSTSAQTIDIKNVLLKGMNNISGAGNTAPSPLGKDNIRSSDSDKGSTLPQHGESEIRKPELLHKQNIPSNNERAPNIISQTNPAHSGPPDSHSTGAKPKIYIATDNHKASIASSKPLVGEGGSNNREKRTLHKKKNVRSRSSSHNISLDDNSDSTSNNNIEDTQSLINKRVTSIRKAQGYSETSGADTSQDLSDN